MVPLLGIVPLVVAGPVTSSGAGVAAAAPTTSTTNTSNTSKSSNGTGISSTGSHHKRGSAKTGTSDSSGTTTTTTGQAATTTTVPATTTTTIGTTTATTDPSTTTTDPPGASGLAISVSGNQFVNQNGDVVQLRGVNRPGTEYGCVDDLGFTSGVTGSEGQNLSYAGTVASSLLSWNAPGASENAINTVRVPLNEDCWLDINGVPSAYSGANYQTFIEDEVADLTPQGMYVVLDLHWSAQGSFEATSQNVGPDEDHSVTFWQQVATAFEDDPSVMFDLYNEPHIWCYTSACSSNYTTAADTAWGCYLNGCEYTLNDSNGDGVPSAQEGYTFEVAGTQQLVDTIRGTGASNVIFVEGLGWANAFDNWVSYRPTDPDNQLAPEVHTYPSSGMNVNNLSYLNGTLADGGLSSDYPIYVGEFGEVICSGSSTGFTENTMNWADSHGYSYTAWGWDDGEGCGGPSLVTDDDTGATSTYGSIVEAHLRALE